MSRAASSTVLLVEDDDLLGELAEGALLDFGHAVVRAKSADTAWNVLLSDEPIDVVLSDVYMPGSMTGAQLAARIPSIRDHLPVVLMSGNRPGDFTQPPGVLFLPKPFDIGQMLKAIDRSLSEGGQP